MSDSLELDPDFDLDARQLCPDGGCTGLIGADGRCKLCGALGEAPVAAAGDRVLAAGDPQGAAAADSPADWRGASGDGSGDEFDARQLCPDGNCTGLIGADGRCKLCGKSS